MTLIVGENFLTQELADIFAKESSGEEFYGFLDHEPNDQISDVWDDEVQSHRSSSIQDEKATPKPPAKVHSFRLRVALPAATHQSTDDEDAEEEEWKSKERVVKNKSRSSKMKKRHIKLEEEEEEVSMAQTEHKSDSAEDVNENFLAKRARTIKANRAMLAQLMADLQIMPGSAGLLRNHAGKQRTKDKSSRRPCSPAAKGEPRRNPERASRRHTRSMGVVQGVSTPRVAEVEFSLEEELLQVRAPRRRGTRRPNQSKAHTVRPVEDITEDDLQLVADNTTYKVHNSVTGSTCHQCRQKTVDTKTCCRSEDCCGIQGQFCGPCLRNRYGEDVRKALLDPEWRCPPCRGICNCSFCRQREGRCPTGILFPLAQHYGFSDVHSYLSSLRKKLKNEGNDVEM